MIQFFIKIANNWVGKFLFAAILFGMVFVWGIGGLSNTSRLPDEAILVGNKRLTMKELDDVFKTERQNLSTLMGGQYISMQKAMEMGLLDSVVKQQVNEMLTSAVQKKLGLTASNAAVQKYVERNPAFADVAGHFDRNLFLAYLRQKRLTEAGLAQKLQQELAAQHLTRAVESLAYAPEAMTDSVYRYQNETRDITAILIDPKKINITQKPSEEELKDYYDVYASEKFITPEYRGFIYVRLTPEMMLDRVKVSDDEVDAVFDERKAQFKKPEKRLVSQMYFKDEAAAKEMMTNLTIENFNEQATQKLGQSEADTSFGYVAQNELMAELAEPVFQAKVNTLVGPVESMTGWHILLVKDIQKAETMPEAEIRENLKKQLAQEKIYDARDTLVRKLEEILGEGKSLKEASQKLKLQTEKIKAVDVSGLQANGEPLSGDLANKDLLQSLFTLTKGDSTPLFESGNSIIVAELTDITPVGTKPYESVKKDLIDMWTSEKRMEAQKKLVSQVMANVEEGHLLPQQKELADFELIEVKELARSGDSKLPPKVVLEIFKQKPGIKNAVQVETDKGTMIVATNQINQPTTPSEEDRNATAQTVQTLTGADLKAGVMATYADELGVKINGDDIKRVFSVYESEQ